MKTINRTIERTTLTFTAYSFTDKTLFNAEIEGYEMSTDELIASAEQYNTCKILEITSQTTKRYKLTIDIQKAIDVGTIEEID